MCKNVNALNQPVLSYYKRKTIHREYGTCIDIYSHPTATIL